MICRLLGPKNQFDKSVGSQVGVRGTCQSIYVNFPTKTNGWNPKKLVVCMWFVDVSPFPRDLFSFHVSFPGSRLKLLLLFCLEQYILKENEKDSSNHPSFSISEIRYMMHHPVIFGDSAALQTVSYIEKTSWSNNSSIYNLSAPISPDESPYFLPRQPSSWGNDKNEGVGQTGNG